jgi:hypothetical protein
LLTFCWRRSWSASGCWSSPGRTRSEMWVDAEGAALLLLGVLLGLVLAAWFFYG